MTYYPERKQNKRKTLCSNCYGNLLIDGILNLEKLKGGGLQAFHHCKIFWCQRTCEIKEKKSKYLIIQLEK